MIQKENHYKTKPQNDSVNAIIRDTADLYEKDNMKIFGEGFKEFLSENAMWESLIENYSSGLDADESEAYEILCDNLRSNILQESVLANVSPIASLAPAILRKFFPKICIKDAMPTEVTTVPSFKIGYLVPYVIDINGNKLELPKAQRDKFLEGDTSSPYGRQLKPLYTGYIPIANLSNLNLLTDITYKPADPTDASKYTIDNDFRIVKLKVNLKDEIETESQNSVDNSLIIEIDVNIKKDINGNIHTNIDHLINLEDYDIGNNTGNNIHSTSQFVTGDVLTTKTLRLQGIIFGHIDVSTGILNVYTKLNQYTPKSNACSPEITHIKIEGWLSPEMNNYSESVTFEIRNKEVQIGAGSHITSPLPIEFLQDVLAMFKIDGSLKIIDLMSTVLAQAVDVEAWKFLTESYRVNRLGSMDLLGNAGYGYTRSFNVVPPKEFVGRPKDWREEIKDTIDYICIKMRNDLSYPGGKFTILANPLDARLITNINWVYTAGQSEKGGVQIDYSFGNFTGANYYELISTENIPQGKMRVFFFPSQEDQMTYKYFPYTFNIESNGGYRDPRNPNVPAIMMTKRHTFEEFVPLQGEVIILGNEGNIGALPWNWSETAPN